MPDRVGEDGLPGVAVEGVLRELERVIERLGSWVGRVERLVDREMLGERVVARSPIRVPICSDRDGVTDRDVLGVDGVLDREMFGERVLVVSPIRVPILCDCVTDRDVLGVDCVDGAGEERLICVDVLVFTRVLVFVFVRVDTFWFDPNDRCSEVIRLRELLRADRLVFGVTVRTEGV